VQNNVFQDPSCYDGNLDHTLVAVGYQLLSPVPYFILRNSWGRAWGDAGYIRMAMFSPDYSSDDSLTSLGTCGIYVYPAYYPIPAREWTLFSDDRKTKEQLFQAESLSMGHRLPKKEKQLSHPRSPSVGHGCTVTQLRLRLQSKRLGTR